MIIVRIVPLASKRLALQGELQTGLREGDEASSQNQCSVDCTTFIGMLHNRSHFCAPQDRVTRGPSGPSFIYSTLQEHAKKYLQGVPQSHRAPWSTAEWGSVSMGEFSRHLRISTTILTMKMLADQVKMSHSSC
jgi:hypothetical protein